MDEKDKAELLLQLADRAWRDFDKRRSYEWKFNFALWPALAGFAGLVLQGTVTINVLLAAAVSAVLTLILVTYTFVWTPGLRHRNWQDRSASDYYCCKAASVLGVDPPPVYKDLQTKPPFRKAWSHVTQVIITFLLVLIAALSMLGAYQPAGCRAPTCAGP